MVFLALFAATCAAACLLVAALIRSPRLLVHLLDDRPKPKGPAIAGPPQLSVVNDNINGSL